MGLQDLVAKVQALFALVGHEGALCPRVIPLIVSEHLYSPRPLILVGARVGAPISV